MKAARAAKLRKVRSLKLVEAASPEELRTVSPEDSLRAFAETYYEWLRVTQHSEETIHGKQWHLEKFFDWCELRAVERLSEVTPGIIETYQKHVFAYRTRLGRPLSVTSQRGRLLCLRVFFEWLIRKRFLTLNPAGVLDLPRMPFKLPKSVFTLEEITKLLDLIDVSTPLGLRDRAIIEVFYSSGVRRKELHSLKLRDLDPDRGFVRVMGKGRRERISPIGNRAIEWVRRYLSEARPQLVAGRTDPDFLFVTKHGKQISKDQLSKIARTIIETAKIDKDGACHAFRHSFATHLLDNDTDIRFIQAMLGHKNIESTKIYTHVSIRKLKEVHSAKHPMARSDEKTPGKTLPRRNKRKT